MLAGYMAKRSGEWKRDLLKPIGDSVGFLEVLHMDMTEVGFGIAWLAILPFSVALMMGGGGWIGAVSFLMLVAGVGLMVWDDLKW